MTHDIYIYILNRERVRADAIAGYFPGREHDALHLVSLGLIRPSRDASGTTFRIKRRLEKTA